MRTTGTAFARALERVDEIRAYRLGRLRLSQIPPNRMAAMARYALGSKAPLLERTQEPKRTAMLTAVMRHLEAKAIDEALDLFQVLMATRLLNTAKRKTEKERLSTLPQLEKASRVLARAAKVLLEELVEEQEADLDVAALWATVEEIAPRAAVMTAAATVVSLVSFGGGVVENRRGFVLGCLVLVETVCAWSCGAVGLLVWGSLVFVESFSVSSGGPAF